MFCLVGLSVELLPVDNKRLVGFVSQNLDVTRRNIEIQACLHALCSNMVLLSNVNQKFIFLIFSKLNLIKGPSRRRSGLQSSGFHLKPFFRKLQKPVDRSKARLASAKYRGENSARACGGTSRPRLTNRSQPGAYTSRPRGVTHDWRPQESRG